jgi:hypothetical protein
MGQWVLKLDLQQSSMSLKQPSADHYVVSPDFFITSKQITAEVAQP